MINNRYRMKYNTQQKRLPLPEYGRSVQSMVDHALTITDRAERQRCANTIVNIMGNMFPHLRDIPDFKHKLWDHLAIMSDFRLDIDYPVDVIRRESLVDHPEPVSYSAARMRYRHYGRFLEDLIKKAAELPNDNLKLNLVALIGNQMKKSYISWNKEAVDEQIIANDLRELSQGKLELTEEITKLMSERMARVARPRSNYMGNNGRNNNYRKNNRPQGGRNQ